MNTKFRFGLSVSWAILGGIILGCVTVQTARAQTNPIPHLAKHGTATQLIVDGKPFLILGGELHNSTSSSLDYMKPVLAKFSAAHLNTALASVCWDLIEPEKGKFDFILVDGAIKEARRNNLHLV